MNSSSHRLLLGCCVRVSDRKRPLQFFFGRWQPIPIAWDTCAQLWGRHSRRRAARNVAGPLVQPFHRQLDRRIKLEHRIEPVTRNESRTAPTAPASRIWPPD